MAICNFLNSIANDSDQWASQDSTELSIDQQMSSKNIYFIMAQMYII